MRILKANVLDPALSGEEKLPARLELLVTDMPDEATYTKIGDEFSVIHYGQLAKIYSDRPDWNDEDTEECAVIYNNSDECESVVFPVTVSIEGGIWEVFYMRVKKIRPILSKYLNVMELGYEILPDPTWAIERKVGWYLQHKSRACVRCASTLIIEHEDDDEEAELHLRNSVPKGDPVEVWPHRLACLCPRHAADQRASSFAHRSTS